MLPHASAPNPVSVCITASSTLSRGTQGKEVFHCTLSRALMCTGICARICTFASVSSSGTSGAVTVPSQPHGPHAAAQPLIIGYTYLALIVRGVVLLRRR